MKKLLSAKPGKVSDTEGFLKELNRFYNTKRLVDKLFIGKEGKSFKQPTTQEAEEFILCNPYPISIQHIKLNMNALRIVEESQISSITLHNVKAPHLSLVKAIANAKSATLTLKDDPNKIQKLLKALQKLEIKPTISLQPPINASFHLIGGFMVYSRVSRMKLIIERGNGILTRKSLRLVSKLKKLKEFNYQGNISIADFYWLSIDENRKDIFSCDVNEDIVLFPKEVSMKGDDIRLVLKHGVSLVLRRDLLTQQQRRYTNSGRIQWELIQSSLKRWTNSISFRDVVLPILDTENSCYCAD